MDAKTVILGISAIVAGIALYLNSKSNKRKSTIDLVLNQRSDEKLAESRSIVIRLNESHEITKYAMDEHKGSDERNSILDVLNNYEFIATGMRDGAFDISLYRRMRYSTVKNDWHALKPFVYELRRQHNTQTAFQEFEWLARKFTKKSLKVDNDC